MRGAWPTESIIISCYHGDPSTLQLLRIRDRRDSRRVLRQWDEQWDTSGRENDGTEHNFRYGMCKSRRHFNSGIARLRANRCQPLLCGKSPIARFTQSIQADHTFRPSISSRLCFVPARAGRLVSTLDRIKLQGGWKLGNELTHWQAYIVETVTRPCMLVTRSSAHYASSSEFELSPGFQAQALMNKMA